MAPTRNPVLLRFDGGRAFNGPGAGVEGEVAVLGWVAEGDVVGEVNGDGEGFGRGVGRDFGAGGVEREFAGAEGGVGPDLQVACAERGPARTLCAAGRRHPEAITRPALENSGVESES